MAKQNFKVAIRNSVGDNSTLELFFLDDIFNEYDWWTGDTTNMVNDVVKQVKNYNPKTVILTIDSQGGDASIGLAIYNFLKHYGVKVETDIIGMAGSIASVMAMAANKGKLKIARNGFMVIHKAWGGAIGNSDDLRNAADVVDMYTRQIVDIYAQRTGKSVNEINALIEKGDYWMTGSEAVAQGFADETYNDNEQFQIAARVKTLAPDYRNIPQNLITDEDSEEEAEPEDFQSFKTNFMKFKDKVNAFIDAITGKKIEKTTPETLSVDVANLIGEPMKTMIEGLQTDVSEEIKPIQDKIADFEKADGAFQTGIVNSVTNAVFEKYEQRIKDLEAANAKLEKENGDLKTEIQDKLGKESHDGPEKAPKAKVIGSFGKATAEAE
ncbi:Clp protease ClpP [Taibaiella lutea]|uniref:ATP-dependent Clp protease proteolytic subunit n=1 Tax=Taibaiella lutea TaxID=2608001 RepID=A0A5M6CFF7_9BACT|nr:head maturation protease, ClpP-related [Taibaiella lutea]KAA5532652.1 Clp protease ClpP [Taibaiella lutea]